MLSNFELSKRYEYEHSGRVPAHVTAAVYTKYRPPDVLHLSSALLFPNLEVNSARFLCLRLGEVLLPVWLLVNGVNVEQWENVLRHLPETTRAEGIRVSFSSHSPADNFS